MENFLKTVRKKDREISDAHTNKELENLERILLDLENEHRQIKDELIKVENLTDLIEHHNIEPLDHPQQTKDTGKFSQWLAGLSESFEKLRLKPVDSLAVNEFEYLQTELSKLKIENERLKEEHKHLHVLIAKATLLLMNAREEACKELTKGHSIASVGEKLLEHFGHTLEGTFNYNGGKKLIYLYLGELFPLSKIHSKRLFHIMEKSKMVIFDDFVPAYDIYETMGDYDGLVGDYSPLGKWMIKA